MIPQIQTLTEYFECDLRLRDEKHTFIGKVFLRLLPRIGEGMTVVLPGKVEPTEFTINHISHVAGTSTTNHVVTIYVEEGGIADNDYLSEQVRDAFRALNEMVKDKEKDAEKRNIWNDVARSGMKGEE